MGHIRFSSWGEVEAGVAATFIFNEGAKQLTSGGTVTWASDTIKARLVEDGVVPDIDDTSITGYTAVGTDQTLGSKTKVKDTTNDRIVFDAADPIFGSLTPGTDVGAVVVYKFVTNDADSVPLFCLESSANTDDGSLTVAFANTGIGYVQE